VRLASTDHVCQHKVGTLYVPYPLKRRIRPVFALCPKTGLPEHPTTGAGGLAAMEIAPMLSRHPRPRHMTHRHPYWRKPPRPPNRFLIAVDVFLVSIRLFPTSAKSRSIISGSVHASRSTVRPRERLAKAAIDRPAPRLAGPKFENSVPAPQSHRQGPGKTLELSIFSAPG